MLKKVISGGQSGADLAGLDAAIEFGYKTGGTMPFGYRTLDGCHPDYKEKYGCVAHKSSSYVPRTRKNVKDADGTIQLAYNFRSPGEVCTSKAVSDFKKPHVMVDLSNPISPEVVVDWLDHCDIEVLNVAGNSEQTATGTYVAVKKYMSEVFKIIKERSNDSSNRLQI